MNTDVSDIAAKRDEILAELERRWNADRFDHHVTSPSLCQLHHFRLDIGAGVDDMVSAHALGCFETARILVDGDQNGWREQLCGQESA